jgi:uncharacterized membrane protein
MTASPRLRNFDERVWRIATWAAPFTIQVVLGVAVAISWLLGKNVSNLHGFAQYASGTAATLLLSAALSAPLFLSNSPRAQGVAISIVGSLAVSVVGGVLYGFWIIAW